MAAEKSPSERICAHMNAQHSSSIHDYALFFARLPSSLARTATLTSVSTEKLTLTITSAHGATSTVNIPLHPPMADLGESRERLVALAHEAMEGLGRSRYTVTRWVPPGPLGAVVSAAVCFGYWSFWNGAVQFARGGFVREYIFMGGLDAVAAVLAGYCKVFFCGILAIHVAECVWMQNTRLPKHSVFTGSALWWKWIAATFIEGIGSVKRFDGEVRRLQAEGKKAH